MPDAAIGMRKGTLRDGWYIRGGGLQRLKRFYLDTFIGDGTDENPFRPATADGDYSIIDLRADVTQQAGYCLVGADSGLGVVDFGDTLDQQFSSAIKTDLGGRLGLTLDQTDFRGIIAELMLLHGREDGTRWRGLKQNRQGNHKILLGGQVVYDAPVIQGTTLQDTFVEASDTDLISHTATGPNSGFTWAFMGGVDDMDTIVRASTDFAEETAVASSSRYRISSDLASADHYVQFEAQRWATASSTSMGPAVRFESGAETGYLMLLRNRASNQYRLFEATTGSFTQIAVETEALPSEPATVYLEIDGSSLDGKMNGVSKITVTDTTHTGNLRTGLWFSTNCELDDFKAEDLGAAPAVPVVRRRQLTTVRM